MERTWLDAVALWYFAADGFYYVQYPESLMYHISS